MMQTVYDPSDSEEHIAFRYHRLRALRLSLLVLSFAWVTAPISAHLVNYFSTPSISSMDNVSTVFLYPTFVILLSSAMLAKSSKTQREKVKIMSIPLSFLVSFFIGVASLESTWGDSLAILGSVGIFVCPLWAAEIVRQRTHEYAQPRYNVLFLVLNHLTVIWLLLIVNYPWLDRGAWVVLSMSVFLLYVVGFLGFRKALAKPLELLEEELRNPAD